MTKTYKIRKFQNGKNRQGEPFMNYSLTIPSVIAEKLPQDMKFECHLTEEGLLFKPSTDDESSIELPSWAEVQEKSEKPRKPVPRGKEKTHKV